MIIINLGGNYFEHLQMQKQITTLSNHSKDNIKDKNWCQ